ncbi:tetratricopeptide repeat protein [Antarcticirhabdus aurantiaca]|uniref:Tetratricopeptide repeat protein n=1 Tax=Antarcticirhabdus aurantiaca TaxID=2606717 RepID=A0ACD4NSR0_9HYPH|nr:tetratricopeptide repeat protein [Antarcticirhabdus aurantiaca]WAJ29788.1 tetratricopeptide repeat protein [Jeongeuplla avenae]
MQTTRLLKLALLCAALSSGTAGAALAAAGQPTKPEEIRAQTLSGAYLAAKAAQVSGDLQSATDFYAQALVLDPSSELLQQDAMFAYLADGRFDEAVGLAARLRDASDAGKVARLALGVHALTVERYEDAIAEFDIVETNDLDKLLLNHLTAWAEFGRGDAPAALERIAGLDDAPWYPVFNDYQGGLIAAAAGRPDEARTMLQRIVGDQTNAQASPETYLAAVDALARVEARTGHKKEAIDAIRNGLMLTPTFDPLIALEADIEAGKPIDAPADTAREGAAETLRTLGQAIKRGDGQQVALLYFHMARALNPNDPSILTALAELAEQAEQLDLAISYYEQVPDNSPYSRMAELQMGLDLWYADRKEEAKTHLRAAIELRPDDIFGYRALANVLSADESYKEAAEVLTKAIELSEPGEVSNWNLYYQRGIAYERQKLWDKAEPDFKTALQLSPEQPQVLNYLGYSWVDMGRNLDEGLDMIRKAVELRPNDGYIIDSLGWAYYRLGRYPEAVEELERAVLITPADPTINDHLGDAYWRVGRQREARFQWDRALKGDPAPAEDVALKIRQKLSNGLDAVAAADAPPPPAASGAPAPAPAAPPQ